MSDHLPVHTMPQLFPRDALARLLHESYAGPAWHGPSLLDAIREHDAESAGWRPAKGRNTAWELAVHCAYGRHLTISRLDRDRAGRFPRKLVRPWWPAVAGSDAAAWEEDIRLLAEYQDRLLATIAQVPAARFSAKRAGQSRTLGEEVAGLALHDAYHAGQIVLLGRLSSRVQAAH